MTAFLKSSAALGLVALLTASAAIATAANAQDDRSGRYTMHKADDGFVRLDTLTGALSLCRKTGQGWGCTPMSGTLPGSNDAPRDGAAGRPDSPPDSPSASALAAENAELRAEIRRLEELLELRGERRENKPAFKLPTEKEVDQALDYFENMLKKFQDRLKRLEENSKKPEQQL